MKNLKTFPLSPLLNNNLARVSSPIIKHLFEKVCVLSAVDQLNAKANILAEMRKGNENFFPANFTSLQFVSYSLLLLINFS